VVPGGRVLLQGRHLPVPADGPPHVLVGEHDAHVVSASNTAIRFVVPAAAEGGAMTVRVDELPGVSAELLVARQLTTGIHQVDSPAYDALGRLYLTQSGSRGTQVPVPIFRIGADGVREPLSVDIANPTSMTLGPDRAMYVSSRFDGQVYRLDSDDTAELYASELGVATGLAFGSDGSLFVGDRLGSIMRVTPDRQVQPFATLPPSVAAFHLAFGPDHCLYVTAPTLSSHDPLYRISPDRLVDVVCDGFGRPQGLAFDAAGMLYVVDALAGASGVYRVDVTAPRPVPELLVGAASLVGVAFDPGGRMVLASNDTVWTFGPTEAA